MTLPGLHRLSCVLTVALIQPEAPEPFTGILPGELAEPLHFPHPGLARWPLLALLALAILWALYRRWLRRRSRARDAPVESAPKRPRREPRGRKAPTFGQMLHALQKRILASRAYRDGCHDLAYMLKGYFESTGLGSGRRVRWTRMTAREVRRATGGVAASELLVKLSDLRFRRDEPTRGEFQQILRRAQKVTGQKARKRRLVPGSETHE